LPLIGEPKVVDSELIKVVEDAFAVFPLNESSPDHHLVIGQTGSGKTTLITRMVDAALKNDWKVVVLDLKGDPTDVSKFLELVEDQSKIRLFPNHSFDFWKGTPNEIAERVISFFPTDSEPFYLNRNANAIHSVISRSGLPAPTSIEELLERVRRGIRHARTASDISFFSQKERGQDIGEVIANDISIYLDPIRNVEAQTPFRFHWKDDWKLGIFSLDGFEPSALKMADALLHDFASWIFSESRASSKSPILLVVDEASAFHALPRVPILSALIQRARSAQVSLVFASQSLSAFKDEKENLLHSGAIRWLGNSTEVEDMVEAAGTRSVVESGFQFDEMAYTGMLTHRSQKEFKIDPDFVKELRTFHWFVSSRGKVSSVFVPPKNWG
jgi:energy-coupling factor transporter ATP-binding protein EcfA2